jgi:hypothetical protein
MNELETKKAQAEELRKEIWALEAKKRTEEIYPELKKLEGTYWKYRNCYSCPKSDADYWWKYRRISNVTTEARMDTLDVEIDKNGRLEIKTNQGDPRIMQPMAGWVQVSREEWLEAVAAAKKIMGDL